MSTKAYKPIPAVTNPREAERLIAQRNRQTARKTAAEKGAAETDPNKKGN